jgi:periplasmic glucans biosynthesis protein
MDRRTWLKLAATTAAAAAFPMPAFSQGSPPSVPFSEDWLDGFARELGDKPYKPFEKRVEPALANLPFDQYNSAILFKEDQGIWRPDGVPFWIEPRHTAGPYYSYPVNLYSVEGAQAFKIPYSANAFEFKAPATRPQNPAQSDFAGFRAFGQLERPNVFKDFLSFLGGTNFHAIGSGMVPGVSARAFAINTGQAGGEDFPLFRSFWFQKPKPADSSLTIYGLFDSQNAAGWLKFVVTPGWNTVIDTEAAIYPRRRIPYAGIAPMASRFFFGPGTPPKRRDYRPRAHDSEALYIVNGAGEQIWRPLLNPERLQFSVFVDKKPKGFGLIQKERYFSSYQDAGEQFEKRPTLWIEPLDGNIWNEGSIDLIELPAPDEKNENIVCFWRPKDGLGPGIGHRFRYRMHWCWNPPLESKQAVVTQTRVGEEKSGANAFIVDFYTGDGCPACGGAPLAPAVAASAGEVRNVSLAPLQAMGGTQRLRFDFVPSGSDPIDLRAHLTANGKPVSDTWIFRWAR